jgi:hypothetical protein
LEETAAHHLGDTGHSAFIEDENEDIMTGKREYWDGVRWVRSVIEKKTGPAPEVPAPEVPT